MKFIELTRTNGVAVTINTAHIVKLYQYNDGAILQLSDGENEYVNDSYHSVRTKLSS